MAVRAARVACMLVDGLPDSRGDDLDVAELHHADHEDAALDASGIAIRRPGERIDRGDLVARVDLAPVVRLRVAERRGHGKLDGDVGRNDELEVAHLHVDSNRREAWLQHGLAEVQLDAAPQDAHVQVLGDLPGAAALDRAERDADAVIGVAGGPGGIGGEHQLSSAERAST